MLFSRDRRGASPTKISASGGGWCRPSGPIAHRRAQTYPARPVHLIVGFAAGGAADVYIRIMGQWLAERLGQQFVVENRTGAGSDIAPVAELVRSPLVLIVNPSVPTKTVPEFIAYAKANPGKLNFASAGNGTA